MSSFQIRIPRIVKEWFSAVLYLLIASITAVWSAHIYLETLDFDKRAITTEVAIVEIDFETRMHKMVHKQISYLPVVQFTDTQGKEQLAYCRIPRWKRDKMKPGDTLSIVYLPETPQEVRLVSNSLKYGCVFWMIAGTVITITSAMKIRSLLRK